MEQGATSAPGLGSYDWDLLTEQVVASPWSPAARAAGAWALERLRAEFGPRWPPAWSQPGGMPAEVASCSWALAGLSGTIGLALAFERLGGAEGLPQLRKAIKRGTDQGRFASLRLQVRLAALARSAGHDVALEPLIPGGRTKADLIVRGEGVELAVEALAMLRDARTMAASSWLDSAQEELRRIGQRFYLDFEGSVELPLGERETIVWLAEVRRYAGLCAQGISLPPLKSNGVTVEVKAARPGGGIHFRMPTVSYGERLGFRLAEKAEQTRRSRARWLLIDSLDHLWHMTQWSQQSVAQRGQRLAALFKHELRDAQHLDGVIISDGAALMRQAASEYTVEAGEFIAVARRSDAWHIRETVIVPLRLDVERAVALWRFVLDAESGWVERELSASGLAQPPELAVSPG